MVAEWPSPRPPMGPQPQSTGANEGETPSQGRGNEQKGKRAQGRGITLRYHHVSMNAAAVGSHTYTSQDFMRFLNVTDSHDPVASRND